MDEEDLPYYEDEEEGPPSPEPVIPVFDWD